MNTDTWRKIDACLAEALEMPTTLRRDYLLLRLADDPEAAREACKLADCADHAERLFSHSPINKFTGLSEGSRIGPWELIRPLGSGGMGVVWMARRVDGQVSMYAAIKLLPSALLQRDSELHQRFLVEKQILARLHHPNIARLLDAGAGGGENPNFVMEYVDGELLLDYLTAHPVERDAKLRLFLKICDAIQYAHGNLTIHRDLKPQNILVESNGEPKLLDFGIGKILNESAGGGTITLHRAFSIDYASPEQLRGGSVSTSTDIYSLGLILFEILSGERARRWNNKALGEVLELADRFSLPAHPAVGRDLSAVIRKATMVDPELRYRTASELAADVERVMAGRPVEARPAGALYQLACFARRNRWPVAASGAAFLSIVGLATWGWVSAEQARREKAIVQNQARLLQAALSREEEALKRETASRRTADQQREAAEQQAELARKFAGLAQRREEQAEERQRDLLRIFENTLYSARRDVPRLAGGTRMGIGMIERTLAQLQAMQPSGAVRADHLAIQADAHTFLAELYAGPNSAMNQNGMAAQHLEKSAALWQEVNRLSPGRISWQRGGLDARFALLREGQRFDPSDPKSPWIALEGEYLGLVARAPEDRKVIRAVGSFYFWRALRRQTGSGRERQRTDFQNSLKYFQQTLDENDPSVEALRDTALAHKYLSGTLAGAAQQHHAMEALRLDKLRAVKDPADANAKLDVAFSLSSVGDTHYGRKDLEAAQKSYWDAYVLRKELNIADPANVRVRRSLAYPLRAYGNIARQSRKWEDLVAALREFDWMATRIDGGIDSSDRVFVAYWKGILADRANDHPAACAAYHEAHRFLQSQTKPHEAAQAVHSLVAGCTAAETPRP